MQNAALQNEQLSRRLEQKETEIAELRNELEGLKGMIATLMKRNTK